MRRLQVITNVNGGTASLTALIPFNLNGLYYANPNPGSAQTLTVTCVVHPPPPPPPSPPFAGPDFTLCRIMPKPTPRTNPALAGR